jgi:hypothetical protein
MDTTQNFWFTTEPVIGRVRLNINGNETGIYNSIKSLTFSPDGNRWAVYAVDNVSLNILSNDTILKFSSGVPSDIVFSGNSQTFVYSYKNTALETIHTLSGKFEILNRTGSIFSDFTGNKAACIGRRGNSFVINNNGIESDYYDAIKPIGFWSDGSFLYAAKSGNGWEIYKDNKSLSQIYKDVVEFKINLEGTIAALVIKNFSNKYQTILISDEYYEPVAGKSYDGISNIALHPSIALYAYNAYEGVRSYVVFNSSEYSGSKYTSKPSFSSSGDEMFFIGCDIDCFLSVNGKRYDISNSIDISQNIVFAPGSETIAYTSSSSLIVKSLTNKNLNAGMMVDTITSPRYNWRSKKYEAMGMINNKLYILSCRPK